jgi:hypothetical protein
MSASRNAGTLARVIEQSRNVTPTNALTTTGQQQGNFRSFTQYFMSHFRPSSQGNSCRFTQWHHSFF